MDTKNPINTPDWANSTSFKTTNVESSNLNAEGLTPSMADAACAARGIPSVTSVTTPDKTQTVMPIRAPADYIVS